MGKAEVKDQIIKWLSKEKNWSFQEHPDLNYYFTCKVKMSERMGCNVCIENDIERVDVIANGKFSESDAIRYKLAPKNKKDDFWVDLKMNLVNVGVNVDPKPDIENLQSIQIAKLIYFDRWSQDRLINTMLRVTEALELTELIFRNFSEKMSQQGGRV